MVVTFAGGAGRRLYDFVPQLGVLGAGAAAFAWVAVVDPNQPGRYPTCPFLAVTGHWCPGCGTLRAMHALARGDLLAAAGLNLLAVACLPLLAVIWGRWSVRTWTNSPRDHVVSATWIWALLAVVLVFGVVRNLPIGAVLAP